MKYAVILGDGMADLPEACPGGRTPLELARTPVLDRLCGGGETGLVRTVPEGMAPGSDTANLSILGYEGKRYYRGRASLEALALAAGLKLLSVPGADGSLDTDYGGKARAALKALLEAGMDFCYVHLEAPDAAGHKGSFEEKIRAIENLDRLVAGPIYQGLKESGEEFRILVLPDHATPAALKIHTAGPVPYLLYDSRRKAVRSRPYCEKEAEKTGILVPEGQRLLDRFLFKGV